MQLKHFKVSKYVSQVRNSICFLFKLSYFSLDLRSLNELKILKWSKIWSYFWSLNIFDLKVVNNRDSVVKMNFIRLNTPRLHISFLRFYSSTYRPSKLIRQHFLDFFCKDHNHHFVKSSSVIPYCDPTLSFCNAGMNQVMLFRYLWKSYNTPFTLV